MNLYPSISTRKSSRDFVDESLPAETLTEIESTLKQFDALYPGVQLAHRFVTKTKGLYNVKAPHYVIVSGTGKQGEKEAAGFLLQQLCLWFDSQDIGSVWLGNAKDVDKTQSRNDIITMAFGKTKSSPHRTLAEFKRKPLEEITTTPDDACIQAVHLAPSGMNLQPWYLEKTEDKVVLYEQILKGPVALAYDKTSIDMGIALCHYAQACKHLGKPFSFVRTEEESNKKGYKLFGEISA